MFLRRDPLNINIYYYKIINYLIIINIHIYRIFNKQIFFLLMNKIYI